MLSYTSFKFIHRGLTVSNQLNFLHLIQNNPVSADLDGNCKTLIQEFSQVWQKNPDTLIVTPALATTGNLISDKIDKYDFSTKILQNVKSIMQIIPEQGALILGTAFLTEKAQLKSVFLLMEKDSYKVFDYLENLPEETLIKIKDKNIILASSHELQEPCFNYELPKEEVDLVLAMDYKFFQHSYLDTLEESHFDYKAPLANGNEEDESWDTYYDLFAIQDNLSEIMQNRTRYGTAYLNIGGSTDGFINYGSSFFMNASGDMVARAKIFDADSVTLEFAKISELPIIQPTNKTGLDRLQKALVVGIRDYVEKNNFKGVILGLSGGIDSALVAALATQALGKDKVHAVLMPYKYTSNLSIEVATQLAQNLGIEHRTIKLDNLMNAIAQDLNIDETLPGAAWQNAQARNRALLLMTLSNQHNWLLLGTGNKSEISMGYTTLYGDLSGGFSPIKDLYKTQVYALTKHLLQKGVGIPQELITRAPTAELAYNQTDQDTLPSYDMLDEILYYYLEEGFRGEELEDFEYSHETINKIIKDYSFFEFKRKQAPPGIELTQSPSDFITDKVINNGFYR